MASVQVLPDAAGLARAAAEHFIDRASHAVAARGRFAVALSGGSTPRALFTLLATDAFRPRIDWPHVHLFWGDERCVSPDDPQSNYRMTREALLDKVAIPPGNVHRILGEQDPAAAADAYEATLRTFFGGSGVPVFDLILLGMGDNGHTASLFPGTWSVRERQRWVAAEYVEVVGMWRITFTPVLLNAAAQVTFLVAGAGKAAMLKRVLEGPYQPDLLPAQVVRPTSGELLWLVDAAAAVQLTARL